MIFPAFLGGYLTGVKSPLLRFQYPPYQKTGKLTNMASKKNYFKVRYSIETTITTKTERAQHEKEILPSAKQNNG